MLCEFLLGSFAWGRMPSERRRRLLEVAFVVATGAVNVAPTDALFPQIVFVVAAVFGWGTYAWLRWRSSDARAQVLVSWGLSRCGLANAWRATSLFGLLAIACIAAIGAVRGTLTLHWHMLPLLCLYPIWGLVQHYLVQVVLVDNLVALGSRMPAVLTAAALLFGAAHMPNAELSAATALLGLVFAMLWLRWRNLWPLALWHGWLGVAFYFWVLGVDPLEGVLA